MASKLVLTPLLVFYCATLVFASIDRALVPRFLELPHALSKTTLHRVGITPGMRVFPGTPERVTVLLRARCTVATGIHGDGRKTLIYPTDPCPSEGFKWMPVLYDHLIVHWMSWIQFGNFTSIITAVGDHFCQQANDPDITHVELQSVLPLIDYETGERWTQSEPLGIVECRR